MRKSLSCLGLVALLPPTTMPAVAQGPFGSPEDQKNLIAGICSTQLDIGAAACVCLAERSLTELDEGQRGYLIMSAVQPPAAERLPIAKSQEQLAHIFTFLETAAKECAAEGPPAEAPAGGSGSAAPDTEAN